MTDHTLYDRRNRWTHISGDSTTVIKDNTLHLVRVIVGTDGGANTTVTLTTEGNTLSVLAADANAAQGVYEFDITLVDLTVVIANESTTTDITVIYK